MNIIPPNRKVTVIGSKVMADGNDKKFVGQAAAEEKFRQIAMTNADEYLDLNVYPSRRSAAPTVYDSQKNPIQGLPVIRYSSERGCVRSEGDKLIFEAEKLSFASPQTAQLCLARLMTCLSIARVPYEINGKNGIAAANLADSVEVPEMATLCISVSNWSRMNKCMDKVMAEINKKTQRGAILNS